MLFSSPEDLPGPGIEPVSPALADVFFTTETPGKSSLPAAAKSLQSWPTLCNPIEGSPPGSHSLVLVKFPTVVKVLPMCSWAWFRLNTDSDKDDVMLSLFLHQHYPFPLHHSQLSSSWALGSLRVGEEQKRRVRATIWCDTV